MRRALSTTLSAASSSEEPPTLGERDPKVPVPAMPPDTMPRWKRYKKEKAQTADPGIPTNNMARSIAKENGVSPGELAECAEFMDVAPVTESYLLPIVAEAMKAPLPAHWVECEDDESGMVYYHNEEMRESRWEHPLDADCRSREHTKPDTLL